MCIIDAFYVSVSSCDFSYGVGLSSVSHVPAAANGELPVQATAAVVRQMRQAKGGDLLRGVLPSHEGTAHVYAGVDALSLQILYGFYLAMILSAAACRVGIGIAAVSKSVKIVVFDVFLCQVSVVR